MTNKPDFRAELGRRAFYKTDSILDDCLRRRFPNGCSLKEAIEWAQSLPIRLTLWPPTSKRPTPKWLFLFPQLALKPDSDPSKQATAWGTCSSLPAFSTIHHAVAWAETHNLPFFYETVPNARFWIYWLEGWVKLTLHPSQCISLGRGGPTDEGFSCTYEEYSHQGHSVECTVETNARDCDGRIDHFARYTCGLEELQANTEQISGLEEMPPRPRWTRLSASQRDHAAEAMGY